MSQVIWKYEVKLGGVDVTLELPKGAQILTLQMQHDQPCMWVEVNSEEVKERRRFFWAGTGHEMAQVTWKKYIGTVQFSGGAYVFHLYEYD